MFSTEADIFFLDPKTKFQPGEKGTLYMLRRDISLCFGICPETLASTGTEALWPGTMAILAGIDLLAKFTKGTDSGQVGDKFKDYLERYGNLTAEDDRTIIYQLRNAMLHSFGLYSKTPAGKIYRFAVNRSGSHLIVKTAPDSFTVNIELLRACFENSIANYVTALASDTQLQQFFTALYPDYGRVFIG